MKENNATSKVAVLVGIAVLFGLTLAAPAFAEPKNSDISISASPSGIPLNAVTTIQLCMNDGQVGTIASTSSGHGPSGLKVTSPENKTGDPGSETTFFYAAAKGVVLPACPGQPLPSVCPTPPSPPPGTNNALECTNGYYSVKFGQTSPGWTIGSGPKMDETADNGTYTINVDYKQTNGLTYTQGAFFDAYGYLMTGVPEFAAPAVVLAAVSLLGLVVVRRRRANSE
jgi:hypothetical protein